MRSELFLVPIQLGGVPLFGMGILLAIWLAVALFVLGRHWRAKGIDGEFYGYLPLFIIGALLFWSLPRLFPEGLPIRGYGVMVLLGVLSGFALAMKRVHLAGVTQDQLSGLAFWVFIYGILGARLFFVIEYWDEFTAGRTWPQVVREVLKFTEGGLVVYGSLIGAGLAFLVYCRKHKLPMLKLADIIAPSLVIGLACGRLGCLLNGCCFGGVCDKPWAITFPRLHTARSEQLSPAFADQLSHGELQGLRIGTSDQGARVERPAEGLERGDILRSINGHAVSNADEAATALSEAYFAERPLTLETTTGKTVKLPAAPIRARTLPVHPTQVYESITGALLAWFTWAVYPFRRRDGVVMALLLTIYPVTRFLMEIIRVDESAVFGTGLSISQNVSLVILAAMVPVWISLFRKPSNPRLPGGVDRI